MVSGSDVGIGREPLRRALVVAGMHRSGTSAMARMLSLLGAVLPKGLMEPQADNPVGFWESAKVADFNDEILHALDSDWDDVFSFRPRPYLSNFDRAFVGRAVELLEEEFDGAELIALKDPRVSVLTAFWHRALRDAGFATTYVIMVRNPLEVAESLRKRNHFPREKSLLLWSSYMTAVERDTRKLPRTFVLYDQLLRDWRDVRRRIQETTGVPFPRDTAAAANEIDRYLDGGLRNHRITKEDLFAHPEVPNYVKTLYRVFLDARDGAEVDEAAIDEVNAELDKIESSVGAVLADLRAHTRTLEKEAIEARDAESAASDRAETLLQELAAERAQRHADAERASQLSAEQERQIADLSARTAKAQATAEAEQAVRREVQDALAEALNEKTNLEAVLSQRIAALTDELRQKDISAQELMQRISELSDEILQKGLVEARLSQRITALTDELRQKEADIGRANDTLEQSRAEKRMIEARLEERFGELASLTRMLAEAESHEAQARADAEWLRNAGLILLNGSTSLKGRLLALLPAAINAKRQRRLLKQMGLFDGDAYLAANPDVAAEDADPLRHYLNHGITEDRHRG